MKITINVDCTPEEARQFLGLPDVQPMQDAMMQKIQQRMEENLASLEPEALFKTWLPVTMQGMEQFQKFFQTQMGAMGGFRPTDKE